MPDEDDEMDDEDLAPLYRLERNDTEGALKLLLEGELEPDEARVVYLLQDDSGKELARRYAEALAARGTPVPGDETETRVSAGG